MSIVLTKSLEEIYELVKDLNPEVPEVHSTNVKIKKCIERWVDGNMALKYLEDLFDYYLKYKDSDVLELLRVCILKELGKKDSIEEIKDSIEKLYKKGIDQDLRKILRQISNRFELEYNF